ncbi:hypothetical protein O1L55_30775 [Streptomyces albulus]|nr:hypothetical protein [Streptomyces noursei]
MAHHTSPPTASGGGARKELTAKVTAHRELFARLAAHHPHRPEDVRAVLPSHFARMVLEIYLSDVGHGGDKLALDNVGRIAHCLGSDPLIDLADRLAGTDPAGARTAPGTDDGHLVLLGAGISHLAAVLLGARPLPDASEERSERPRPGRPRLPERLRRRTGRGAPQGGRPAGVRGRTAAPRLRVRRVPARPGQRAGPAAPGPARRVGRGADAPAAVDTVLFATESLPGATRPRPPSPHCWTSWGCGTRTRWRSVSPTAPPRRRPSPSPRRW